MRESHTNQTGLVVDDKKTRVDSLTYPQRDYVQCIECSDKKRPGMKRKPPSSSAGMTERDNKSSKK